MTEDAQARASLDRFIERLGLYFEEFGLPRISGRLLGLLLISDRPLSLDEIATALHVSRGSVSTNARMLTRTKLIERVGFPGDRRDYYAFTAGGWEALIETDVQGAETLREFAAEALDGVASAETPARPRLQAAVDFLNFYAAELQATLARWRAHTRGAVARNGDRPPASGSAEASHTR
jgi:DNA-binding MarR family transcriptional regulator